MIAMMEIGRMRDRRARRARVNFSLVRTDETPAALGGSDQKAGVRDGAPRPPPPVCRRMNRGDKPQRLVAKRQPEIEAPKWLLSYK
jgi:hypothetical protein